MQTHKRDRSTRSVSDLVSPKLKAAWEKLKEKEEDDGHKVRFKQRGTGQKPNQTNIKQNKDK